MSAALDVRLHTATFAQLGSKTLYGLLRLRVDVFVVEQNCPYGELDGRDLEPDTTHMWFADPVGGDPLAYLRVLTDPEGLRIGRVVTVRRLRCSGLAGRLLDAALCTVAADRVVRLHAQLSAVSLYAKRGFVAEGGVFLEDGIQHVMMSRLPVALPVPGQQERRGAATR